jgi:hypothetical protein
LLAVKIFEQNVGLKINSTSESPNSSSFLFSAAFLTDSFAGTFGRALTKIVNH